MPQMQNWHDLCLGQLCDVRVRETVDAVIRRTVEHFGCVDIVANCTGYGVIGACEDQDLCDLRSQFETNFFGTLNIIQATLPYFRKQNGGRYLIFSSTSGALGVPGLGPYCATKYAVEGLIESMLYEIDSFGVKATLVAPGHLRLDEPTGLDDKGQDLSNTPEGQISGAIARLPAYGHFLVKPPSAPYAHQNAPAGHAKRMVQWMNYKQPTSAVKSAELVWQLGHCSFPPLRLLLGSYAVESIRDRLRSIIEEVHLYHPCSPWNITLTWVSQIEDWKHLSFPVTDEDEAKFKAKDSVDEEGDAGQDDAGALDYDMDFDAQRDDDD